MLTKFCHQFTPYITWNCFMLVYLMLNTWWLSSSFSECTQVCSTLKTDCHDMTEILLKVASDTNNGIPSIMFVTGIDKLRRFWLYFYITYKIDISVLCQWPVFHISLKLVVFEDIQISTVVQCHQTENKQKMNTLYCR